MRLLGERNWYLPRWLAWLPNLQVEGRHEPEAPGAAPDSDPRKLPADAIPVGS
jgi:putative drug exporter of the RND superfamily